MPPTTENIPEKPGFDVFAMLLILSFFFLLGATLLLNDDLDKNWGFWLPPENLPKKAEHLTQINDDPAKYPGLIKVREIDLAEWKLAYEGYYGKKVSDDDFPEKDFKWPEGYDPLNHPIITGGADNLQTVPKEQIEALMRNYKGPGDVSTTGAAAPAPETPAPGTPPATPPVTPPTTPEAPKEAPKAN